MISMDSERLVKIQSSLIKFSMRLKGKICNTIKDFCGKNLTSYFIVQKEMPTPSIRTRQRFLLLTFTVYIEPKVLAVVTEQGKMHWHWKRMSAFANDMIS